MILISFDNDETVEVVSPESAEIVIGYYKAIYNAKAVKVVAEKYDNQRAISSYANMLNIIADKPKEV